MSTNEFNWTDPLPRAGTTTVLEASAGTGKTFTIAGLVARFVADGVPLDRILAVTFSRRATAELRDGIRERLRRSHAATLAASSGQPSGSDPVDRLLADSAPDLLRSRIERLQKALGQVDSAPIVTLHTFAGRMLAELGTLADHDRGVALDTDLNQLRAEVVSDVYLSEDRWESLGWTLAQTLGEESLEHPSEPLYPDDEPNALRVAFAERVRAEFARRKRERRVMDYDDLITRLADTLTDPVTGPAAADVLNGRFDVVLVDEFQDTDEAQWAFLKAGFHHRAIMVLIGDPKQAIYRFRGGDIETYSMARDAADRVLRLGVNYRSDAAVVEGIEMIFGPVDMGTATASIELHRVSAHHAVSRLQGPSLGAAVQVRALAGDPVNVSLAREQVRRDVVQQVGELLVGSVQITTETGERRLRASDIAVLVTSNYSGLLVHRALQAAGHASVFTGDTSVFQTRAASDWLLLLEALVAPDKWHQPRAMMTSLIGLDSAGLSKASPQTRIQLSSLLARCARLLADQGVAAVFETLIAESQLYGRLLAQAGGEELVTDLRHVAEILNEAQTSLRLSPAALTEHLRRSIERAKTSNDERTRRLASDRPAVKVMTVHAAKGLQFPVVLLPEAANRKTGSRDDDMPVIGHVDGRRVLDVAAPALRGARDDQYQTEELAESLRVFYVACTRAQSRLICWWAPTLFNTQTSPLHRLLMNNPAPGHHPPQPGYPVPEAARLPGRPLVEQIVIGPDVPLPQPAQPQPDSRTAATELGARTFIDHIDRTWVRTSYTGLTADVHAGPQALTLPESDEVELPADEQAAIGEAFENDQIAAGEPASALADLPGGVEFGSLVHAVLEVVDPATPDLTGSLTTATTDLLDRYPLPGVEPGALVSGLAQCVTTPLGVLTGGLSLRDLGAANRLAELDFELPLGAGSRRGTVADLAALFDTLPAGDPLHDYGAQLAQSGAADGVLAGFLTGSIDVVLQVPGPDPRFVVLDYKTNRVPVPAGDKLLARHYSPAAMTSAMSQAHYPLQALLYCAALHRYLDWRLPGYDPGLHLGGVGYLFVRGMVGPDNPVIGTMPSGVFIWRPPAAMIVQASRILAGGR